MADRKDEIRAELEQIGITRRRALEQADITLDQVLELLAEALAAGLTKSEISQLTAVSRPTLDELQRRQ